CSTSATATTAAGTDTGADTCTGGVAANYTFNHVAANVTVNQAALLITASSLAVTYGSAVPTINAIYGGFVNGQGAGNLTTPPTCSTTYTTSSAAGTTPSTSCTGATDANYSITYVAGQVTVNQATPTVIITNTVIPTGIGAGNLTFTATVTGVTGGAAPSGTLNWTIMKNGSASACTSSTGLSGSGPTTATCTIATPGVGNYTAAASYLGNTDYAAAGSAHTFGFILGSSGTNPLPTTASDDFLISGTTFGTNGAGSSDDLLMTPITTITSVTGYLTTAFPGGSATILAEFTVGTGSSGFSATNAACNVVMNVNGGANCTWAGTPVVLPASTYLDMKAQREVSGDSFNGWWIVTYTQ
ncbi:MAG: MBG domain-containing protein, partial [Acidimicrobiales bacterium]